jgi:hypothetical protein
MTSTPTLLDRAALLDRYDSVRTETSAKFTRAGITAELDTA